MESETQTTDAENDATLLEYDEIMSGRHETNRITWRFTSISASLSSHKLQLSNVVNAALLTYILTWTIKYFSTAFNLI